MVINTIQYILFLLTQVSDYCNEFSDVVQNSTTSKLRGISLYAQIDEITCQLANDREKQLSSYFGDYSLKQCLEFIVSIEDIQDDILKKMSITDAIVLPTNNSNKINTDIPIQSSLWGANKDDCQNKYRFKKIFHEAHENLKNTNNVKKLSQDPNDIEYIKSIRNNQLEERFAYQANPNVFQETAREFQNSFTQITDSASKLHYEVIFEQLYRSLELLRNVFMCEVQDIYYIRTGNFADLVNEDNKELIEKYYTEQPLREYFMYREEVRDNIKDTLDLDIEEWRIKNGFTNRRLEQKEYITYLTETKQEVYSLMKEGYPELWKLREHSGSLNENVTYLNFARMFYRRKNVDSQFLELQWKLELIDELIEAKEKQTIEEPIAYSPEQAAVKLFIDNINDLANAIYDVWNEKTVSLGARLPESKIIIKKEELAQYLQDLKDNHFEYIRDWCYPPTANYKQNFVKFVVKLRDEGYFGKLPNNLIAPQLAPIVMLATSTVTNYLSQKQE